MKYNFGGKYLPEGAEYLINKWLENYNTKIIISKKRKTKLGDYKKRGNALSLSVNNNLNPSFFFFTLTHEIAHLIAFEIFGQKIKPHGKEWKSTFKNLLVESHHLYPEDFGSLLPAFWENPKASLFADAPLASYYIKVHNPDEIILEEIPLYAEFVYQGKLYKKGEKRKIRYLCTHLKSGKKYLFNSMAPIEAVPKKVLT